MWEKLEAETRIYTSVFHKAQCPDSVPLSTASSHDYFKIVTSVYRLFKKSTKGGQIGKWALGKPRT